MKEIIKFVSDLIEKGYAYEIDGDVYFSTKNLIVTVNYQVKI